MTRQEEKEIIRVCGKDFNYLDIPPSIRKRDEAKIRTEEAMVNEHKQKEIDIWDNDRGWITIKKPIL